MLIRLHKKQYIRKLSKNLKLKNKKKMGSSKQNKYQYQKYPLATDQLTYEHFGLNYHELYKKIAQRKPLLLAGVPPPRYKNPQKAQVIISKKQRSRSNQLPIIPYQNQQQQGVKLAQFSFEEFQKYNGQFLLSVAQMKLQKQDVVIPDFVRKYFIERKAGLAFSNIQAVNLWYYKGQRLSQWHYDGHDNFLFVLKGVKKVYLYQPKVVNDKVIKNSSFYMKGKSVFHQNNNHSQLTQLCNKEGNFDSTNREVNVHQGQCLFIPRGWWHKVQSYGNPNIAVNIWGNSIKDEISVQEQQIMLKHLMFELTERICSSVKNWQDMSEEMRTKYRQSYFYLYLENFIRK